jgi:uncharacterized phage infection (PIP) family protein YhgE
MSKFVTQEVVESRFVTKNDFEKSLFPYVKQTDLVSQIDKHTNNMDTIFYRSELANDTFMKSGAIDDYYNSVENVSTNIEISNNNIKRIGDSLQNFETKETIRGVCVLATDFDKVKDAINKYRSDVDSIQELIDDSQFIYEATSKTMNSRFESFYREIEKVKEQQEYIKSFMQDENNKINTEQIFAYQRDFAILNGDVGILEESASNIDNRVDNVETKLIEMAKKMCVGEECLQYADVKDLKNMVNLFRSTYEQEKDLLQNIEADMIEYKADIVSLQERLAEEIQIRIKLGETHEGYVKQLRDKMVDDNRILSDSYDKMIDRIEKEKKQYKDELESYRVQNYNSISTRNREVTEMQNIIINLESQIKNINKEKSAITSRLNELIRAYEDENGGYNIRMQEKTNDIQQLQERLDNASSYLSNNQILIETTKQEITKANADLRTCSSSLNAALSSNTGLTSDVARISNLLSTAQSGSGTLQEELVKCNVDRFNRVTTDAHELVANQLRTCEREKNNDYISRAEVVGNYTLTAAHNSLLNKCEGDKKSNYLSKQIVESEFVPQDQYLLLLKELDNPVEFMKTVDVMKNFTANSKYRQLEHEYNTQCIRSNLLDAERDKFEKCQVETKNNYTLNDIVNNSYITKKTHEDGIKEQERLCEVEKQTNYVHKNIYRKAVAQETECEKGKKDNYVPIAEYRAVVEQEVGCKRDKETNYYPITYVQEYYKSNNVVTTLINNQINACQQRLDKDYLSKEYVNKNYITNTAHNIALEKEKDFSASMNNTRTTFEFGK